MADNSPEIWPVYLLRGDEPLNSTKKIKQWMKRLRNEQERLIQLTPALKGPSDVANLSAANALREWHLGRLEKAALLRIDDDAMELAKPLGALRTQIKIAQDLLVHAEYMLEEQVKTDKRNELKSKLK